ncbi:MAG: YciI family protein [Solirubrobacteraceae bacterium]
MKYALLIYSKPGEFEKLTGDEQASVHAEYMTINGTPGIIGGDQLQPPTAATTIRVQNGQTLSTDGPFADTKEVLAGYYLIESDDIEAPLAVAARIPAARMGGSVEVRPIVQM